MNFGKKNTERQLEQMPNRRVRSQRKFLLVFLRTVLICFLVMIVIAAAGGAIYTKRLIDQLPDASTIDISPSGYQTKIYDIDGNEIKTLAASGANREYVTLDQIPENLQHAFVAIEDSRFYEHNGIDVRGIVRAVVTGITSGGSTMQGASTITQQLLKNNYFTSWTSESTTIEKIERKIQEQYLAVELEKVTTKDEILENYLNTINLGQNTLGVEAAANRYFNKEVSDLTLSECAVIAAITQNPSRYNPISHPDNNATRRKKVLNDMEEQGYITAEEKEEALADDVYDRIQVVNSNYTSTSSANSYFVDALTDEVTDDLIDAGYSETEAYQMLYAGGLQILSTQDMDIQEIVDEEVNDSSNYDVSTEYSFTYRLTVTKSDGTTKNYSEQTMLSYYRSSDSSYNINFSSQEAAAAAIEAYKAAVMEEGDTVAEGGETVTYTLQPQTAVTIIDNSTGMVLAMSGGRGEKTGSKTLNRAYAVTRQPGSTFKILTAYSAALDSAGETLATVKDDAPMTYSDGTEVNNVDFTFRGYTTYREAITDSINTVAIQCLTDIGTGLGYQYALDYGISTLTSGDNVQSLALGGITYGVTNVELTAAYAAIANGGVYNEPILYTQVLDRDGNVILDNTDTESHRVIQETTAWLLTSAMEDVMTEGTGTAANISGMAVAGKSGTTNERRDFLFEGYTPYYTCGIWGGYDDNTGQAQHSYTRIIWRKIMTRLHSGLTYKDFEQPDGIVTATVCSKSGKLAVAGVCDADPNGSCAYTEYFTEDTVPTEYCDRHVSVTIDSTSGMIAHEGCPSDALSTHIYILNGDAGTDASNSITYSEIQNNVCTLHNADGSTNGTEEEGEEGEGEEGEGEDDSGGEDGGSSSEGNENFWGEYTGGFWPWE